MNQNRQNAHSRQLAFPAAKTEPLHNNTGCHASEQAFQLHRQDCSPHHRLYAVDLAQEGTDTTAAVEIQIHTGGEEETDLRPIDIT